MMNQQEAFRQFLVASNLRKNSIDAYSQDVNALLKWLMVQNINSITDITVHHISEYIEVVEKSGKNNGTISRQVTVIRSFCRFLEKQGVQIDVKAIKRNIQPVIKKSVLILPKEEVQKILSQPNTKTAMGLRDYLMLRMLYETGIKVSEMIDLKISNIDLKRKRVTCQSDYSHRIVYLNQDLIRVLKRHLALKEVSNQKGSNVEVEVEQDHPMFTNCFGRPLSRQALWKTVKSCAISAGLSEEVTPHTLRHSFAVHLLQDGGTIRHLQIMMGHQDLSSTQMYENYIDQIPIGQESNQIIN